MTMELQWFVFPLHDLKVSLLVTEFALLSHTTLLAIVPRHSAHPGNSFKTTLSLSLSLSLSATLRTNGFD
jgi:hypothetical protein